MLILTEQDVAEVLRGRPVYKEAIAAIEEVFRQQATGTTFYHKRVTVEHPDHPGHLWHNIRILPGMVPGIGSAAVRVYTGYQGSNRSEVILLFDWKDMGLVAIISDYLLHTIRTAAPYGVATKYLAPPNARRLGIIGTGRLARGQVEAVCAMRDIRHVKAYSRSPENREAFCEEMARTVGIEVVPADSAEEAVRDADIIVASTSGNQVVLKGDWLRPAVLVMSVAPGEIDERTVERSRVILAGTNQALGDSPPRKPFSTLVASGRFSEADVAAEFHEVVTGKKPGRLSPEEITLFVSPGMGILDVGVANWIYRLAVEKGVGQEVPFGEKVA
ncbi:MAG: ornithine cyclodeaminase family protein [Deltaproteobacteria bacterium]|nr:ornithine cyclodeaminase family protein [Deltaproteobacteria bacterium]